MVFYWYFFTLPLILSGLFKIPRPRGAGPPGTAPRYRPRKAGYVRKGLSESNCPWQGTVGGPHAFPCIAFTCSPRWCAPHQGRGDPARLPDHRLGNGLSARRHLDTLLPLLPPGIGQDVVLVRAQLEGVRDLHGRYQIRTENLYQKKNNHPTGRVKGSGTGWVHARPGEGILGKWSPGDSVVCACVPNGTASGCTLCHLRGEVWAGFRENKVRRQGLPMLGQAAPSA